MSHFFYWFDQKYFPSTFSKQALSRHWNQVKAVLSRNSIRNPHLKSCHSLLSRWMQQMPFRSLVTLTKYCRIDRASHRTTELHLFSTFVPLFCFVSERRCPRAGTSATSSGPMADWEGRTGIMCELGLFEIADTFSIKNALFWTYAFLKKKD